MYPWEYFYVFLEILRSEFYEGTCFNTIIILEQWIANSCTCT